jgi:hypothetical protein
LYKDIDLGVSGEPGNRKYFTGKLLPPRGRILAFPWRLLKHAVVGLAVGFSFKS